MDGCSKVGIFFRIILPLIQPVLVTAAIFSFYWTWEDFLSPLIYLNSPKLYTLSLALRSFADPRPTPTGAPSSPCRRSRWCRCSSSSSSSNAIWCRALARRV